MINAVFGGGLGNQMFLYAYIYAQIKENNLNKNIYAVMHKNSYEDNRKFALKSLNCSIKINPIDEEKAKLKIKYKIYIRKQLSKVLEKLHISHKKTVQIFKFLNICYSPDIYTYYSNLKLKNNSYIEGAFQTWKYFKECRKELINEFTYNG